MLPHPTGRRPTLFPPPTGARAGWYPDPYGQPFARYYDGYRWSPYTAPLPPPPPPPPVEHPSLPFPVVIGAVAILAGSLIGSRFLLDALIDRDWPVPVLMAVSVVVGYAPSVAWLWYASRRWGSGRPFADLGVSFRWVDLAWGPLIWLATIAAMGIVLNTAKAVGIPYRGNLDLDLIDGLSTVVADVNRTAVVSLVVSAVICAPVVEEAIFRGAVLRGLLSKMPAIPAIGVQGVLFGSAHFNPDFGRDNIGLLLVLSVSGIGFGVASYLLRRVGPTIIAHAVMNGVAVSVAIAQAS
ncbi:type II CAAX prenyl endopeptidase Rce1 family protein [Desertimonas flava]|uniref:CPBP family glutamic-type intramembrane protease n=1 Tax=Desertimonas flava TaxID=2064846 RepID=UPI000E35530D|nr:CPBP family glutamic-type intramembrane protease [Desertimonas flava]